MPSVETALACQDPELFWAYDQAIGEDPHAVKVAVTACTGCPISLACYQHGVDTRSAGVFGGVLLAIQPRWTQADHCKRGHPLTQAASRRRTDGTRACRTCETTARHKREGRL